MKDRMSARERVRTFTQRKRGLRASVRVQGIFRLYEEDRETGVREFVGEGKWNTVTAAGLLHFLNLGVGASSDHLDGDTYIKTFNGSGTLTKSGLASDTSEYKAEFDGCDAGYPKDSSDAAVAALDLVYQWTDDTPEVYDASQIKVYSPDGHILFSERLTTGWDSKPADKNWIYTYTLSITDNTTVFEVAGLDHWMHLFAGTSSAHWTSATSASLYDIATDTLQHAELTASSGPTVDGDSVTWEWTFGNNDGNGAWDDFYMEIDRSGIVLRSGTTNSSLNKGEGDTFIWTYVFSIS